MKGRGMKRNMTDALELPKEVVLNLPLISITGREELTIENYKGIIEYGDEMIRINTASGMVRMKGKKLLLKQLTAECVVVTGSLEEIAFIV